jgi:FAD/FMN-containing dehydrogenase
MTVATRPTAANPLLGDALDALRSALDGALLTPGHPTFDEARAVQDFTNTSCPLAIVRATHARDVATAVSFARQHELLLTVRSGGHSLSGHSMADNALVIDLSGMNRFSIEPQSRVARVQPGVTSGDFAGPASKLGLALTTGDTSSVGFGGLATGGGIGYMVRKHGLTIDHLLSAQVVTADGAIVTASPDERPDLFWAIRGGSSNVGIVTEFTFRLESVPQILGGDLLLPASREVIRGYLDYTADAPDGLTTIANIMHAPPAPFVPAEWVGQLVVGIIVCWTGDAEEGERAIAPLRALATPVADTLRPMPYPDIYLSTAHQALPHGAEVRSMFADDFSDAALDAMLAGMQRATTPYSIVHLRGLGGAMARVAPDATAFAHRQRRYLFLIAAVWLDPAEDGAPHRAWARDLWSEVRHEGNGVYVNFLDAEGAARVHDAYPSATHERLAAIKTAYDPENLFRMNQNVLPAT